MARFGLALALLLSSSQHHSVESFQNLPHWSGDHPVGRRNDRHSWRRSVASSSSPDFRSSNNNERLGEALTSVTSTVGDTIASAVRDEPDADADAIALKQQKVSERTKTYTVTLPLTSSSTIEKKAQVLSMGMRIGQINRGREFGTEELNLDTLELANTKETKEGMERMDELSLSRRLDGEFQGLVVAAVDPNGAAWAAGVRPGDMLMSTSATVGSQRWPKSTLEGVRAAIQSRQAVAGSIQMELQRLGEAIDDQFELTLTKPIGLELRETEDGYVEVSGFTENAPTLVQYAVQVGDRVLAVDSSLGDKLWPVSTVDGVISSVTSRLPGQQITFRFQRRNTAATTAEPVSARPVQESATAVAAPTVEEAELLQRCRDVIKRYTKGKQTTKEEFVDKYDVPGLVADKVMDALASAGARVDQVTLAMIMGAYLSCRQAQKAIDAFEAITGLHASGSNMAVSQKFESKNNFITPTTDALNIYTASALLKAHAMKGDVTSVRRVLAAIGGRDDSVIDGQAVASWPGTGEDGTLKPDTRCYNIAISALADSRVENAVELALQIFDALGEPTKKNTDPLQKDVVSYNAVINAMTTRGRYDEAMDMFSRMKRAGVKPDKYSYTPLAKAIVAISEDDFEEFLYEMKEQGVAPDAILFNTVVKTLCEQRRIPAATKIVNFMQSFGANPDSMTYGLLMKGLIETGKPSAALTLFETACSDQRTVALTENIYLYTTAISAAAALSDHERALELLARMNNVGITPNMKTMTSLVGACLAANKPDLAYDIYKRISKPDGYAMSQGVRALGAFGKVDEALAIIDDAGTKILSGKQLMMSYKSMVHSSLAKDDYASARKVFRHLLGKGHIPSKAIYQTVFDVLKLFPKTLRGLGPVVSRNDETTEKFEFLLFILDAVQSRNLPCEGPLYSAIITYGSRLGGLPRKICSLLASAKASHQSSNSEIITADTDESQELIGSWEDAFLKYDDLKSDIDSGRLALPKLSVRVNAADLGKVLRAEKFISVAKRKPRVQEV